MILCQLIVHMEKINLASSHSRKLGKSHSDYRLKYKSDKC